MRPFLGDSPEEIARRHILEPHVPLSRLGVELDPALEQVIDRALAKDPRERFAGAEAMLSALDDVPRAAARRAALRAAARSEEESTALMVELGEPTPSRARRLWAWLRFGRWRWSIRPAP